MTTQLRVQGSIIQHILEKILGFQVGAVFTGTKGKEDEYNTYILSGGAITTDDDERITIHYYWDYRVTVKNNLFTFPIVGFSVSINHVMKVLTDQEQIKILKYLGVVDELPCVGCGEKKIKFTEMGGVKGVNMCRDCFGGDGDEYTCDTCDCELDTDDLIKGYHDQSVYQCAECFDNDKKEDEDEDEDEICICYECLAEYPESEMSCDGNHIFCDICVIECCGNFTDEKRTEIELRCPGYFGEL